MKRSGKAVLLSCAALCVYLVMEAFLPPASQPTARLGIAMLHAYQATGSKAMEAGGVRCRYSPTCSHYAEDAIGHYGTLDGLARTCGRLWRCSPWGGSGYDPAVEPHSAAYFEPQEAPARQETPEQKKAREDMEKARQDWEKIKKEVGPEAGKAAAACGASCIIMLLTAGVYLAVKIFCMIWAFKDAKARGDQNAVLWPVLIFFLTPVIGMIIYLVARPQGELVPCPSCHQRRLDKLTKCPHCSADIAAAKPPQT